jgi:hypothetical protein
MEINLYKKIIKIFMSISIPDSKSEDVRLRARILEFVTLDGLQRLTGQDIHGFPRFMVKELLDNALDKEGVKEIRVSIKEEEGGECLVLSVSDDGKTTFTRSIVEKLVDFKNAPSSKRGLKRISRGMLGNALQSCIGISYALWPDKKRPKYTVEIIGDKRYLIGLRHDGKEIYADIQEEEYYNNSNGVTIVSFRLPMKEYYSIDDIIMMVNDIILVVHVLNPFVTIHFETTHEKYTFEAKKGIKIKRANTIDKPDIHWYSFEEFKVLAYEFRDKPMGEFIKQFYGLAHGVEVAKVREAMGIKEKQIVMMSELSDEDLERLYRVMKEHAGTISIEMLPLLGRRYFKSIGAYKYEYKYDYKKEDDNHGKRIPYAIEVVSFPTNNNSLFANYKGNVITAVNFSAFLGRTFSNFAYGKGDNKKTLWGLLKDKELCVLIHLICPEIVWVNPAKSDMTIDKYAKDDIFDLVKKVTRQRIKFKESRFNDYALITLTNAMLQQYPNLKFTVRQIFYQLVSKLGYPNTKSAYNRLSNVLTKAREDRLVDPERIIDQSRPKYMHDPAYLTSKESIDAWFNSIINGFDLNRWDNQSVYVECWIEKDALARVIKPVCEKYRVPLIVGKGYSSYTQIYEAAKRFPSGKDVVILYLGDHDPTGLHIEEKLRDRLEGEVRRMRKYLTFIEVKRIALTTEQINRYNLHNLYSTMKKASQKAEEYRKIFKDKPWLQDKVWELDVLSPQVLINLLESAIKELIDWDRWNAREDEVKRYKGFIERELGAYKETLSKKIESIDNKS